MSDRFQLYVQEGPEPGRVIDLDRAQMRLGRSPLLDIVLDDPEVSRQQAIFTRTDAGYSVQDSGSTNGTFVDGRRLAGEPVLLQPGMTIRIGSGVSLLYQTAPDEAASPLDAILDESRARLDEVASAEAEGPDESLPPVADAPATPEMPPERAAPPPRQEAVRRPTAPTAQAPAPPPVYHEVPANVEGDRNRRLLLWGAVVLVVLGVCCCVLLALLIFLSAEGQIDAPALQPALVWVAGAT